MNTKQLHNVSTHYCSMFGNPIDEDTRELLKHVDDVDELEEQRDQLSDGEYDAAEAILLNL